jgi:hypothetical protein
MFARTAFTNVGDETEFVIAWPYIAVTDIKMVINPAGALVDITTADFAYNKDTGETTITLGAAPGIATDDPVIYRETPLPANADDFYKQARDTQHGSTLVMAGKPGDLALLFKLQEMADINELADQTGGMAQA